MPVYAEKCEINGKKKWFIRTYVTDSFGNRTQITRRSKQWIGREGYFLAQQEELRLKGADVVESPTVVKHNNPTITISKLQELYLEFLDGKIDDDTLRAKRIKLNHFCKKDSSSQVHTFPNTDIKKFDKHKYLTWQKEMKAKTYFLGKKEKSYSIKHLNSIHNEVCRMIDFAITEKYCEINFARQCGKIGTPKEVRLSNINKSYETINYNEFKALSEASKDNLKYNTLFELTFFRGPRIGEVRAFKVKDFNLEKKQLMVNHTVSKRNQLKPPKTASSKAPIDLNDNLCNKIVLLIEDLKKQDGFNDEWYIFGGEKPRSEHAIAHARDKYFALAGINKHIRIHDFRHSCATWLFSIGMPITFISKMLRHANINETMKTYTHLFNEDYMNNLNKLNEYSI